MYGRLDRYEAEFADAAFEKCFDLAADLDLTPTQLALKFVDSRDFITSNIIGASNMQQLEQNIDAHEIEWTEAMDKAVHKLHSEIRSPCP